MKTIQNIDDAYAELKNEGVDYSTKYHFSHPKKTGDKSVLLSLGRVIFNLCLPDDYPLQDKQIGNSEIKNIIFDIHDKYPADVAAQTATKLNKEAYRVGLLSPVTFSTQTFIVPEEIKQKKLQLLNSGMSPPEIQNGIKILAKDLLQHYKDTDDPAFYLIQSGAKKSKVNPERFAAMLLAKGISIGMEGDPSAPILNGSADGFSLEEFYANASEARSGLFVRSSGSALPGALARETVYANADIKLDTEDCGTIRYLDLYVSDSMTNKIIGRFYLNEKTNKLEEIKKGHTLTNKTIKLRSPFHCISQKGVCPICYGKLGEKLGTEHVGIVLGSILNELLLGGVAMKTRHEGGSLKVSRVDFTKDILKITN